MLNSEKVTTSDQGIFPSMAVTLSEVDLDNCRLLILTAPITLLLHILKRNVVVAQS